MSIGTNTKNGLFMQSRSWANAIPVSLAIAASTVLLLTLLVSRQDSLVEAQTPPTPTSEAAITEWAGIGTEDLQFVDSKLTLPKYSNLDSYLNGIVLQVESGQSTARAAVEGAPLSSEESVAVTLYITEGYADAIVEYLEDGGASPPKRRRRLR